MMAFYDFSLNADGTENIFYISSKNLHNVPPTDFPINFVIIMYWHMCLVFYFPSWIGEWPKEEIFGKKIYMGEFWKAREQMLLQK